MPTKPVYPAPSQSSGLSRITTHLFRSDILLLVILLVIATLYVLLMVRDTIPLYGLGILAGMWLLHWIVRGRLSLATPMDMPLLALLALLPLSLYISIDRALSLPKVYGLVLGINIFYLLVNLVRTRSLLRLVIPALIILALGITLLGLVGSDWTFASGSFLDPIYNRIPHLINVVPRATTSGINANTIGGALAFFVPLLAGLLWDRGSFRRAFLKFKVLEILYKLVVLGVAAAALGTLFLTQSRGAILGTIIGLIAFAIWKDRRFLWVIPVLLVGVLVFFMVIAGGNFTTFLEMLDTNEFQTLPGRLEAWQNTIYLIQDFPFTGAGIGTYNKLFAEVYTFIPFALQGKGSYHAHNTYLAVAIDLGLPALVLYMALVGSAATMALQTVRAGRTLTRALVRGLACGLLAHMVFGLTDAYLLGTKLGALMWIDYGLIAALYIHQGRQTDNHLELPAAMKTNGKPSLIWIKNFLFGLAAWVLFLLAALAFINLNAIASLVIAGSLGIVLGILMVNRFEFFPSHDVNTKMVLNHLRLQKNDSE